MMTFLMFGFCSGLVPGPPEQRPSDQRKVWTSWDAEATIAEERRAWVANGGVGIPDPRWVSSLRSDLAVQLAMGLGVCALDPELPPTWAAAAVFLGGLDVVVGSLLVATKTNGTETRAMLSLGGWLVVAAPAFFEECLFRGPLLVVENKLAALVVSTIAFAAVHTQSRVSAGKSGLLYGGILLASNSLLCAVIAHLTHNLIVGLVSLRRHH